MMQQEITQPEHQEETIEGSIAHKDPERLPFSRRETIFTMIGVLFVVFLSMLDQSTPPQSHR